MANESNKSYFNYYLNLLYYLSLYYLLYINVNIDVVQGNVTLETLPIVFHHEHECILKSMEQLDECHNNKAWHVQFSTRAKNEFFIEDTIDIYTCFSVCQHKDPACIAVMRESQSRKCYLFKENYELDTSSDNQNSFTFYILKCCKVDFHHQQLSFYTHNLPVSINLENNCYPDGIDNTQFCKLKVFKLIENKAFNFEADQSILVKNAFECMNLCLEEESCKSYSIDVKDEIRTECKIYSSAKALPNTDSLTSYVYKKQCCDYSHIERHTNRQINFMMFYQTNSICKQFGEEISLKSQCEWKIWHVEDELRMKNSFQEIPLKSVTECLNECYDTVNCIGVSIDWIRSKCHFFKENEEKIFKQKKWTTYTLKCCNIKGISPPEKNLEIITDTETDCDEVPHANAKACEEKVWLEVKELKLSSEKLVEKDDYSHEQCAHLCLTNPKCYSMTIEEGQQSCTLHGFHPSREFLSNFNTYFLTCCKKKAKL